MGFLVASFFVAAGLDAAFFVAAALDAGFFAATAFRGEMHVRRITKQIHLRMHVWARL